MCRMKPCIIKGKKSVLYRLCCAWY